MEAKQILEMSGEAMDTFYFMLQAAKTCTTDIAVSIASILPIVRPDRPVLRQLQ